MRKRRDIRANSVGHFGIGPAAAFERSGQLGELDGFAIEVVEFHQSDLATALKGRRDVSKIDLPANEKKKPRKCGAFFTNFLFALQ
jgi:hypothetical protein